MHARVARLAACAILVVAASGCRRQPPATRAPDAASDTLSERGDAGAATDGRLETDGRLDAAADAPGDAEDGVDSDAPDTTAADAAADASPADARTDLPPDAPSDAASNDTAPDAPTGDALPDVAPDVASEDAAPDVPTGDAPADAAGLDRVTSDSSDVRPEDQPCGSFGLQCRPYACDVVRGVCKAACQTDDDCFTGIHCNALSFCGSREDTTCVANDECLSGHCAQGVCCQTACSQRCYSCNQPGTLRTCAPVPAGVLDPIGLCPNGTACDGRGGCVPPSCVADSDCGVLHFCTNGHCVPCSATCVVDAECTAPAICFNRNFCTYCDLPDASAGQ